MDRKYEKPELKIYGDLKKITLKKIGGGDGDGDYEPSH